MTKKYNYKIRNDGKNDTGKPRYYKTPKEMQIIINKYFNQNKTKPTVHGLCLALGFDSRDSLLDYKRYNPREYFDIISRAKLRIAANYEKGLFNKQQARGCIFALNAMFGCNEGLRQEITGKEGRPLEIVLFNKTSTTKTS